MCWDSRAASAACAPSRPPCSRGASRRQHPSRTAPRRQGPGQALPFVSRREAGDGRAAVCRPRCSSLAGCCGQEGRSLTSVCGCVRENGAPIAREGGRPPPGLPLTRTVTGRTSLANLKSSSSSWPVVELSRPTGPDSAPYGGARGGAAAAAAGGGWPVSLLILAGARVLVTDSDELARFRPRSCKSKSAYAGYPRLVAQGPGAEKSQIAAVINRVHPPVP